MHSAFICGVLTTHSNNVFYNNVLNVLSDCVFDGEEHEGGTNWTHPEELCTQCTCQVIRQRVQIYHCSFFSGVFTYCSATDCKENSMTHTSEWP